MVYLWSSMTAFIVPDVTSCFVLIAFAKLLSFPVIYTIDRRRLDLPSPFWPTTTVTPSLNSIFASLNCL